jgi:hypothetical protein
MTSPNTQGDDMTRTLDPLTTFAAEIDERSGEALGRRCGHDLARITDSARAAARAGRRALPTRRRGPLLLVAGATAAAVAVGAVALPGGSHRNGDRKTTESALPDARSFLLASAITAAKAPAVTHGTYWYSQRWVTAPWSRSAPLTLQPRAWTAS